MLYGIIVLYVVSSLVEVVIAEILSVVIVEAIDGLMYGIVVLYNVFILSYCSLCHIHCISFFDMLN
jgi:hypothetical protein